MRCEICRCRTSEAVETAVPMEKAARSPDFIDALADDYFDSYEVPVTRAAMTKLLDTLGGHSTVCQECQVRLALAEAPPADEAVSAEAASEPTEWWGPPPDVGWALSNLASASLDNQGRATHFLLAAGADSVSPLIGWLETWRGDRTPGLRVLGLLHAEEAGPALVGVIADGTLGEQAAARDALLGLDAAALPAFEAALEPYTGAPLDGRRRLVRALGEIAGPAVPLLCRYLEDPEPEISRAALESLEMGPTRDCIEPLLPLLADPNRRARKAVVVLLGRTDDPRVLPTLVEALADPALEVRLAAAWSLTRLGLAVPGEHVPKVLTSTVESWLYAGLLQLCGLPRERVLELLGERGIRVSFSTEEFESAEDRLTRARELLADGSSQEAVEVLRMACRELPFDTSPLALLAQCHSQEKQWPEAVAALEKLIALNPFTARWHHNLGIARFQSGERLAAVEQWRQALLLDPDHAAAREAHSRVSGQLGEKPTTVCIAHPSLLAPNRCATCHVPLCQACFYAHGDAAYCERHPPPAAEESRRAALRLAAQARTQYDRARRAWDGLQGALPRSVGGPEPAAEAVVAGLLGVHAAWRQSREKAEARRVVEAALGASVRALFDALASDPGCDRAALLLAQYGDLYEEMGFPEVIPRVDRQQAMAWCARTNPRALGSRYFVQAEIDRSHALWDHFRHVARSPSAWTETTLRVIENALHERRWEGVLTYLRAVWPTLPRHTVARRQCRARIRSLGVQGQP